MLTVTVLLHGQCDRIWQLLDRPVMMIHFAYIYRDRVKIETEVILVILCCSLQASKALMEIACQSSNVVTPTTQPDGAGRNYSRHVF